MTPRTRSLVLPLAGVALLGMLLPGCVAAVLGDASQSGTSSDTRLRGPSVSDTRLRTAVQSRLAADSALRGANVQVEASGSVVTLRGSAQSAAQSSAASRVAKATSGVSAVVNQLKVP
jgi:osmotically-inducible protein OsmY